MLKTSAIVGCLSAVALAGACQKKASSTESSTATPPINASPPRTAHTPSPASAAWTPERVREFVIDAEALVFKQRNQALERHQNDEASGECYGQPAYPMGKASEIVPVLETRLTGRALACYLASYFGCRRGDTLASAGVSRDGPPAVPFAEAKVAVTEQTPDRIVAEIGEAPFDDVLNGKLNPKETGGRTEFNYKSRYTLTRDAKGVWRISDRIPSFKEWECRER